jgi:hypothetical protein
VQERASDRRIRPAGEARALEPGDAALVVIGQAGDGLELCDGPPPILDDDALAPAHAVDQRAELVLRLGYTGPFHKAIIG